MSAARGLPDAAISSALEALQGLGARVRTNVALGAYTTFRVGGPASILVDVHGEGDLGCVGLASAVSGLPLLVVGQGSNLLVADEGVRAVVIVLGAEFSVVSFPECEAGRVRAGGAVKLPVLARRTAAAGLAGLEWAVGVPGSVGGAVRMNAGGHGSDVAASLVSARIATLTDPLSVEDVPRGTLAFGYRRSALSSRDVVVAATFQCHPGDRGASEAEITEIVRWRREHQPGGANCGSVFTNPPGDSAGRLIDAAGLKGFRIGTASVSVKHANFIQADEEGQAADVWALIASIRRTVHARTGVWLSPEVQTAGPFPPLPEAPK